MSSESNKRYRLFLSRSQHQLKEVEFNCREVISLSQQLNLMAGDVQATEVNSRKIEFMKGEIKDKLREYSSYIDQIYKILDRKLMLLMREIDRESKAVERMEGKEGAFRKGSQSVNQSMNRVGQLDKDTQKTHEKSNPSSYEQDRFFTDTLNPRVMQLEAKLTEYEQNEATQNHKITELKVKNQKLLQEFTRLSTASNRKINQLSSEIHNITGRDKDSFSSADSGSGNPRQPTHRDNRPFILLEDKHQSLSQSPYKQKQKEELSSNRRKQIGSSGDNRPFTFGCMPISHQNQQTYDGGSFNKNIEGYERMDKEDKHRRFDLLLNKLRYGEKKKEGRPVESPVEAVKVLESPQKKSEKGEKGEGEEYTSVFANALVKRYQV